jgi:hypothetical protein
MAKYEARIKAIFGEIVVSFNSIDELKANVASLDTQAVSEVVLKKFESFIRKEPRQSKLGLEDVYRFTSSGLVEIMRLPPSKAETVALVLFAYHPEPALIEQIVFSTGIRDVASRYLTNTAYKKFFSKVQGGRYMLSQEGFDSVCTKILPKIITKASPTPGSGVEAVRNEVGMDPGAGKWMF